MRGLFISVFLAFALSGCTTSEAMLERDPVFVADALSPKSDFRDCIFRWADNPGLRLQYHPDGVWIRDSFGAAVGLVTHIDEQITLYHHWNAMPAKDHLMFLTDTCNTDPTLRPPTDYWKKKPKLREQAPKI